MIYSGLSHPTATLFASGSFIDEHERVIIITDNPDIDTAIQEVGSWIWGHPIRILAHPGEVLAQSEYHEKVIIIPSALLMEGGNLESIRRNTLIEIIRDMRYPQGDLIERLLLLGWKQSDYPGESGTYTREGSIIRLWKEASEYLIEYFDDTIESIIETCGEARTHRKEILLPSLLPYHPPETKNLNIELIEYIHEYPTLLIGCEFLREREILLANFRSIREYSTLTREGSIRLDIQKDPIESLPEFLEYAKKYQDDACLCVSRYEKKLRETLDTNRLGNIALLEFPHLQESFVFEGANAFLGKKWQPYIKDSRFRLITDDVFGSIFVQNRVRKNRIKNLDLLLKIKEGDLVVHREHGIGRYIQILRKRIGLTEREYMEVEYRDGDKVFVPMTELARITKYVGDDDTELSSLEGKEWERTLSKTDEEIAVIAEEILETDARRKLTERIPFGKFPKEEETFRKAFPYTHTPDQQEIIEAVIADMEGPHPMDRLIAGDVGFGKTEIAMNAVYKAVLSGVQVAVISPLLILAEEHRETFEERLGAFGVRVRSLTRMTHAREAKIILEEMRMGKVDVVIGTHRLLSEDVRFRRLGLLVIDEEHRFGVAQKEAIKKMKAHIDILSLSATPIPRSLNLALSGLKKISLLTTPPPSRKPIDTIVTRWDESTIYHAISTELARGGQIIILHNRIRSLGMIEQEILDIMKSEKGKVKSIDLEGGIGGGNRAKITSGESSPENQVATPEVFGTFDSKSTVSALGNGGNPSLKQPKIIITHGQMNPDEIEDRILAFKEGKYDILLTTTIIENGVNFLGANTILVSDAEDFGLAQLHQIRGRVGRKDVAGVCYLLYRKYELSSEERERLLILAEYSALGSGYEIAMRDMQMRGTGDILGFRQSGKTKEVGISLYFQLLEEKITILREGKNTTPECKIDLDLSYVIPDEAFDSEMDKLSFFRDIESIETLEDLDIAESTFESHSAPESMTNLFLMMRSSIILRNYGVARISKIGSNYHFDFREGTGPKELRGFLERFDGRQEMIIVSVTKIKVETKHWKDAREFLLSLTHL